MFVVNKRIGWIDALKGFTILLVLLGHNNPPFIKYIYGFHMPLFFIISGYLYHDYKVSDHIEKIVVNYYLKYFALCIFNGILYEILVMCVTRSGFINWQAIGDNIKGILVVNSASMDGCYPLWFLPVLAISEILFVLIMQVKSKYIKLCLVVTIACIGFLFDNTKLFIPFRIHIALVGVLFLGIGYGIKRLQILEKDFSDTSKILNIIFTVIFAVIGFVVISVNTPDARVDMSDATYGNIILFLVGAILWSYCFMFVFEKVVSAREELWLFRALKYIGKHTIFIMSFDEITNIAGGLVLTDYMKIHVWYVDFFIRMLVMIGCYLIFILLKQAYFVIRKSFSK